MAEEFNPAVEGRRIASTYLSKRNWAREWRRTLERQLYPAFQREEFEAKQRQCDQMEEEAEAFISSEYERWRKNNTPEAKEVLQAIYTSLSKRNDLGFFAQRIIDRIRSQLT